MALLPRQYYEIKRYYQHKHLIADMYAVQLKGQEDEQIRFFNWWKADSHSMWLHDFIVKRGLLDDSTKTIALCSVFGEKDMLELVDADVRIFFSGENLHNPRHAHFAGYMLDGKRPFDLGIGFDYFENERYLRFPLWLTYMFAPNDSKEDIHKKCEQLRFPELGNRNKYAALIARADWNGVRSLLANMMESFGIVDYPSAFRHNDDSLLLDYQDDKIAYLQQYKFNICPENTNAMGYTTEKVFEAIAAGCIPVYWGNYGMPEAKILNPDAIIFWDKDEGGRKAMERINELNANPSLLEEFMKQPRLLPEAEEEVLSMITELHNRLKLLLT